MYLYSKSIHLSLAIDLYIYLFCIVGINAVANYTLVMEGQQISLATEN